MHVHVGVLVSVLQGKGREAMKGLWGSDANTDHNIYILKKDFVIYIIKIYYYIYWSVKNRDRVFGDI